MLEDSFKSSPTSQISAEIDELLESLCSEHQISLDELSAYLNDSTKFDPKKWSEMVAFRQKLEDDLNCVLENITNPAETRNKYKELDQARRWIFVR